MSTTGRKRQNDCPDGSRDAKLPKLDVSTVDWPAFFKDAANQASVNRFFDEPKDSKKYYALRVVRVRDRDLERKIELKAISTEVVAGQKRHLSIYVYFDAACLASLRERDITIKPQDEIYLSLKDARRAKFESDDSPVLQYHTNVIYQYRSCADQRLCGKVVNTADWFNKFASSQSLESDDMDVDEVADDRTTLAPAAPSHEESLSARTPTRSNTTKSMPTPPNTVCGSSPVNAPSVLRAEPEPEPVASEQLEHAPQRDSKQGTAGSKAKSKQKKPKPAPPAEEPHEGVEKLSKGQKKKRQEKRKKQRIAAESPNQGSAPATAEPSPKPVTVATPTIQPVQSVSAGPATPTPAPPATPATWPPPGGQIIQLTAPGEEEGSTVLTTGRGERYIALNTVENKPAGELWSVIGIVEFAKDVKQTKMGDWHSYIKVFDPSVFDKESKHPSSVCIMGYSKQHREWAPQPKQDQVIILRNIKRTDRQNIGYGNRLQWAIYDPDTRSMTHGTIGDEVAQSAILKGEFVSFSPFWHADEQETQYCAYLHQWWQEMRQEKNQEDQAGLASGRIIQIETPVSNPTQRQYHTGRPLLRIADLSFERCNSLHFFDCTVEIVAVFSDKHPPNVYVTDYSSNGHLRTPTGAWVPERFDKLCFKIEMWDASRAAAEKLYPADYYTISNCRLKEDSLGYYEGRQQEAKFRKLNEADAESDPMLKELLERKRKWETTKNAAPAPEPESRAIGEVALNDFFDTVVEVLHVEGADLYVTDYSAHPDLQDLRYDPAWAAGLDGLVLKICTEQVQTKVAQGLSRGNFCRITNLRIVHSAVKGETIGKLGGNERKRIFRVNPALADRGFKELLNRKKQWENVHARQPDGEHLPAKGETPTNEGKRPVGTFFGPRKSSTSSSKPPAKAAGAVGLTFAELRDKPKSKIYTVVARATLAVDCKSWDDCIVRMCAQCQKEIPRIRRACLDCNDTDHEFVQVSDARLLLELTDTTGDTERVAVMSKLRPSLHTEVKASSQPERVFEEWLRPLTGDDLSKVQTADTPLADVVLLSKENETYCLVDYMLRRS